MDQCQVQIYEIYRVDLDFEKFDHEIGVSRQVEG